MNRTRTACKSDTFQKQLSDLTVLSYFLLTFTLKEISIFMTQEIFDPSNLGVACGPKCDGKGSDQQNVMEKNVTGRVQINRTFQSHLIFDVF